MVFLIPTALYLHQPSQAITWAIVRSQRLPKWTATKNMANTINIIETHQLFSNGASYISLYVHMVSLNTASLFKLFHALLSQSLAS